MPKQGQSPISAELVQLIRQICPLESPEQLHSGHVKGVRVAQPAGASAVPTTAAAPAAQRHTDKHGAGDAVHKVSSYHDIICNWTAPSLASCFLLDA
jgi:hypothetical protein